MGEPNDDVTNPAHYTAHPAGIEAITVIQHFPFNVGSAMKYLWRAGLKPGNPAVKDLRKAIQYINFEIQRIEGSDTGGDR